MLVKRVAVRIRQAPHEDLCISMEKAQLISMIHFLEKREEVSKKENLELKELLRALQEEYREDAELTQKLLKTIETLTQQISDITAKNRKLRKKVNDLLTQISFDK